MSEEAKRMKLNYTSAEIEADHDYATPHIECGQKLHGGFAADGSYLSPRTKHRWEAVHHWHQQLEGNFKVHIT